MSADDGDESIFTKAKNLVSYKINNAVSDPEADKFAVEKAKKQKKKEKEKEKEIGAKINTTVDTIKSNPNQFNAKRFFKNILDQTINILKMVFFPFVALMLAMIVANEMIVYTVPIRIIFFIFTFLVCFFMPPLCIILGLFYLLKGAYSYYINNMTDIKEKLKIMPTIYALLPITTYTPESSFGKFFYYPFRYPKSDISGANLPKIMDTYWKELKESFKDLDQVTSSNSSIFSDQLKKLEIKLKKLHDPTQINPIFKSKVPVIGTVTETGTVPSKTPLVTPVTPVTPVKPSFLSSFLPKTKTKPPPPDRHDELVAALTPKTPLVTPVTSVTAVKPVKPSFLSSFLPKTKTKPPPPPDRHDELVAALTPKVVPVAPTLERNTVADLV